MASLHPLPEGLGSTTKPFCQIVSLAGVMPPAGLKVWPGIALDYFKRQFSSSKNFYIVLKVSQLSSSVLSTERPSLVLQQCSKDPRLKAEMTLSKISIPQYNITLTQYQYFIHVPFLYVYMLPKTVFRNLPLSYTIYCE